MKVIRHAARLFYILVFLTLTACGGGGGDGDGGGADSNGSENSNQGGDNNSSTSSPYGQGVTFNLKDASTILVYDNPVTVDNSASGRNRRQSAMGGVLPDSSTEESDSGNLLALGKDGLRVAFSTSVRYGESERPSVNYTVSSPDNRYLYVVMKTGALIDPGPEADPNSQDSGSSGYCFLFKVNLTTDEWSCLPVVAYGNEFDADTRGFGRAVQFDRRGQAYIVGCQLDAGHYAGESFRYCGTGNARDGGLDVYLEKENNRLESLGVFQDNEGINDVQVTKDGDIVYYARKASGIDDSPIMLWRKKEGEGQVLKIIDFHYSMDFTIDDGSTFFYKIDIHGNDLPGVVFAKPRSGDPLSLDRLLLGAPPATTFDYSGGGSLVNTDDGKLLALLGRNSGSGSGGDSRQLWQLLPRREIIFEDFSIGEKVDFTANTAVSISKKTTASHGDIDRIRLTSLVDGHEDLLFDVSSADIDADPNLRRYKISEVTIDKQVYYFAALDLSRNLNVVGALDLDTYNSIEDEEKIERMDEYLDIVDVGSAGVADSRLRDIKTIKGPSAEGGDDAPLVQSIELHPGNPYSVGITFSKTMDHASVEEHVTFMSEAGADVPYMPLWLGNRLHLLVDMNDFGHAPLENGLPDTAPLESGETYTVQIEYGASDTAGNPLANEDPSELQATVTIADP